jgi:oligopeptide/dipeptide ABC transporter ATP-binding protein
VSEALLEVNDLHVQIDSRSRGAEVLRGVQLRLTEGKNLGVVGESGSGKSMTALAILQELPAAARITSGRIVYRGTDLLSIDQSRLRQLRGGEIAIVFQNATAALNPLLPVGRQIADVYRVHEKATKGQAWKRAIELLSEMGMPDPAQRARAYPHELSGGMAQRAMVAMALAAAPRVLIADEPTTGLDLTIEAQVLQLISREAADAGTTLILISHDIEVVADLCDEIAVMYAGEVVEFGPTHEVLERSAHPYTRELVACSRGIVNGGRLPFIPGQVPNLRKQIRGCAFAPRCPRATDLSRREAPPVIEVGAGHSAACHYAREVANS